ncbi:Mut7-C RNAse domain-containing protein [Halostagnicola sp. A-GB9-2]|uniref:Mut7-C RNAse domain-containing protein n=1 Tax=Halostagnicola sp. A-GB9-2 TaxID=3048066 RepID=UPI0024BF52D5|nr:Mut7-C RNAse domain-containing protein [Halostagnicola sp. A-GB9-2]MDJ1431697.1 Mut7-C RNAse domain-containing protein [Halostagnicola sp. A-GB9-2]
MRFLVDLMCGGIVSYLRMCGYDTAYAGERDLEEDDELRRVVDSEGRALVTRDVALSERAGGSILLTSRTVEGQLEELAAAGVDLTLAKEPVRCGRCNGSLVRVQPPSEELASEVPEYVPDGTQPIWRCRACGQYFWKGSHWDDVRSTLSEID